MKLKVYISGYGAEVTQGTLTNEKVEKIYESYDSLEEYFSEYDEDFSWYEIDDNFHCYGAYLAESLIQVIDDEGNTIYEKPCDELVTTELVTNEIYSDDENSAITCVSTEKGTFFEGDFEINNFNPELLTLQIKVLEDFRMIHKVLYNGDEIDGDSVFSTGKDFNVYID
jgi:hypothetical protein